MVLLDFAMLLFFLLTECEGLVILPCFVMLLFVVVHKVCDGLVF